MSKNGNMVPMKENKLLVEVIVGGFFGALAGIILGLILGIIIWGIMHLIDAIAQMPEAKGSYYSSTSFSGMAQIGMNIGTIIGAIFGAIAGLKQQK